MEKKKKALAIVTTVIAIICFLMVEWPIIYAVNWINPMIGGMPFVLVWSMAWWIVLLADMLAAVLLVWRRCKWKPGKLQ